MGAWRRLEIADLLRCGNLGRQRKEEEETGEQEATLDEWMGGWADGRMPTICHCEIKAKLMAGNACSEIDFVLRYSTEGS